MAFIFSQSGAALPGVCRTMRFTKENAKYPNKASVFNYTLTWENNDPSGIFAFGWEKNSPGAFLPFAAIAPFIPQIAFSLELNIIRPRHLFPKEKSLR